MSDETHSEAGDLGDSTELPTPADQLSAMRVHQQIGPYRLLGKLGEGGMGEVWLAEQKAPVWRRVALKVIKHGMDTRQVVARFEAERQALATMNHPAVAKVFDAGSTPRGRPYFVMEYVQGVPIIEYCDRYRLTTRERLELFIEVCHGVQHAHQNAIIHRDLKPSNVLVTTQDGNRIPKVIDFGVAKATSQKLTEKTMFTELGVLIGTPEYMSPEQAEMSGESVDTRTDVYSLGVMLYEMLVGALPFEAKDLRAAGFDGIRNKILEEEPQRPSMRLSSLGQRSAESAKNHRVDLQTLQRQLKGDLDWITMKALEKERTRRYGSPSDLAEDIGRHLGNQPVVARPPSRLYRMGKFVRRHKFGVAAAAVVFGLLVTLAVSMTVQARQTARERDRANQEAEAWRQVSAFMTNLFRVSDPGEARGNSITAREILDRGAAKIDGELQDRPLTQAKMMATMGRVYWNLGLYEKSRELLEGGLAILRRERGEDHPDTLTLMNGLAGLYRDVGRHDEALELYSAALEGRRRVLGQDHPDTLGSMNNLANAYEEFGRTEEAEALYVQALEAKRRLLGAEDPRTLSSMNNLAILYVAQERYDEAEPLYVSALATARKVHGADHPTTVVYMSNLATLFMRQERYDEAEALHREGLALHRRVLGPDHPETLGTLYNFACFEAVRGRRGEALKRLREAVDRGYHREWILDDADFASLRGDPEFEAILDEVRRHLQPAGP